MFDKWMMAIALTISIGLFNEINGHLFVQPMALSSSTNLTNPQPVNPQVKQERAFSPYLVSLAKKARIKKV